MPLFRTKTMSLGEWALFQDRFEEVFTTVFVGDKRLALFIEDGHSSERDTLLIPSYKSDIIEALAPGGWQDCKDATNRHWTLLVGNASAHDDHGLSARDLPQ